MYTPEKAIRDDGLFGFMPFWVKFYVAKWGFIGYAQLIPVARPPLQGIDMGYP
jgi:hypothetical protein